MRPLGFQKWFLRKKDKLFCSFFLSMPTGELCEQYFVQIESPTNIRKFLLPLGKAESKYLPQMQLNTVNSCKMLCILMSQNCF